MNSEKFIFFALALITIFPLLHVIGESNKTSLPEVKKITDGVYKFGGAIINQKLKFIEFNATSNQRNGLIEYALVHESGKVHESLFRTKLRPQTLHTCLLLLKHPTEKRFFKNLWSENPEILDFSESVLETEVFWEVNGTKYKKSLEDLTLNSQDKISLNNGAFIFTGSKLIDGTYLAEISGSIIAVYADEEAVINSMAHDSNNDDVWVANLKDMPELEVLVTIRLHLPRNP